MCSSNAKVTAGVEITPAVARINGRPVLQPTCNRVPSLDRRNSLKKIPPLSPPTPPSLASTLPATSATVGNGGRAKASLTPPISPKSKSPRPAAIKRGSDPNALNTSSEKVMTPRNITKTLERKKSKSFKEGMGNGLSSWIEPSLSYSSSLIVEAPGSIAAVRREQMALQQAQRKMKIAHYGRSKSAKFESKVVPLNTSSAMTKPDEEEKRCSFITPNSDPVYVAYHDEEWGVPVHDDSMLFELLVLSGAQVGSDWISILKKRQDFRDAFSGFDAETVAKFTDKEMTTISSEYGIDISRVLGVVDNSNRILEVKGQFGSFDKYIWGFVNHKAISTQYKFGHKIPVKTSKSESISKDMLRRGFRCVGPTVVHSFMQAAGLTNDHLITCHRHLPCTLLAASSIDGLTFKRRQ
ncbi:DNA glycosylase superfamily protein isoform 1 [Theobroma cacao]|uniref:DNA glycosylase superfamily protein isoform 1 n=1 Tax=Theobroma cacao TaxID=3641 RepID=A0A061FB87_THECC|nr:DNA glycosylase superfamily protein isoform 1 [Theobroma cacao]